MEEYVLYLDESIVSNQHKNIFCIAGAIFNKKQIPDIKQRVDAIKKNIWVDKDYSFFNFNSCEKCQKTRRNIYNKCKVRDKWAQFNINNIKLEDIILHDTEIRTAHKSKHRSCLYEPYNQVFRKHSITEEYYTQIKQIYTDEDLDINIIGMVVDRDKVASLYKYPFDIQKQLYTQLFKKIVKKYILFLLENNGVGSIVIESSNDNSSKKHGNTIDDCTMDMYYNVKANGIDLMTSKLVQQRLIDYKIVDKSENNQCLQLVDSIPNHIARTAAKLRPESLFNRTNLKHRYWNDNKREETLRGVVFLY